MNELKIFDYNNKMVRTIEQEGVYWWVLKDVCKILKLTNPTVIVKRLESDEVTKLDLGGQVGITNVVNESGLYNVILRSDKPEAKAFRKWITSEVIPSIRKTGSYSIESSDSSLTDKIIEVFKIQQEQNQAILQTISNQQMQAQAQTQTQLTAITNLITSRTEPQYEPQFTYWLGKTYKKRDILAEYNGITKTEMLHSLYNELQDTYDDIDLNECRYEYCFQRGIPDNKLYTMNAIGADTKLKKLFNLMIDTHMEQMDQADDKQISNNQMPNCNQRAVS